MELKLHAFKLQLFTPRSPICDYSHHLCRFLLRIGTYKFPYPLLDLTEDLPTVRHSYHGWEKYAASSTPSSLSLSGSRTDADSYMKTQLSTSVSRRTRWSTSNPTNTRASTNHSSQDISSNTTYVSTPSNSAWKIPIDWEGIVECGRRVITTMACPQHGHTFGILLHSSQRRLPGDFHARSGRARRSSFYLWPFLENRSGILR